MELRTAKPANTANGEKDLLESLRVASGPALALEGVRVLDEMNADGPSSKPMTRSMRTGELLQGRGVEVLTGA
jgi:hypothetical protein